MTGFGIDLADATTAEAVVGASPPRPVCSSSCRCPDEFADAIVDGQPLPTGMPVEPLFGGEGVVQRRASARDQTGQPAIDVVLGPDAAAAFDAYAAAHFGGRFAIVLDGMVVGAPTINATQFNGRAQISGAFDVPAVQELDRHPRAAACCRSAGTRSCSVCPGRSVVDLCRQRPSAGLPAAGDRPSALERAAAERADTDPPPGRVRGSLLLQSARCAGPFPS